jgi:hypothetical protein
MDPKIMNELKKAMLSDENKKQLLRMMREATGVEFTSITFSSENRLSMETNDAVPEMGICGRYIRYFSAGLWERDPVSRTHADGVDTGEKVIPFLVTLGYELMDGGTNGFDTNTWFYFNTSSTSWTYRRTR